MKTELTRVRKGPVLQQRTPYPHPRRLAKKKRLPPSLKFLISNPKLSKSEMRLPTCGKKLQIQQSQGVDRNRNLLRLSHRPMKIGNPLINFHNVNHQFGLEYLKGRSI